MENLSLKFSAVWCAAIGAFLVYYASPSGPFDVNHTFVYLLAAAFLIFAFFQWRKILFIPAIGLLIGMCLLTYLYYQELWFNVSQAAMIFGRDFNAEHLSIIRQEVLFGTLIVGTPLICASIVPVAVNYFARD